MGVHGAISEIATAKQLLLGIVLVLHVEMRRINASKLWRVDIKV